MRKQLRSLVATVAVMIGGGLMPSLFGADFITFTDKSLFDAAVTSLAIDTFSDLSDGSVPSPLSRTIDSYAYTVSASGGFYVQGNPKSLETDNYDRSMNFTINSGAPTAMGGYFYIPGFDGGTISVSINGGLFPLSENTNSPTNFFGWVSTNNTPITSFVALNTPDRFTAVSNLVLAQAVPEPSTYALGAIASGVLGFVARRRKANRKG